MTSAIEDLDADLAAAGEDIVIRRLVGTGSNPINVDVRVRAVVRAFRPEELVGTISQTDSMVILSPTEITEAQWPGGQPIGSAPATVDPRIPKIGDKAIIQGKPRKISFVKPFIEGGELVRIELTVAG